MILGDNIMWYWSTLFDIDQVRGTIQIFHIELCYFMVSFHGSVEVS